MNISNYLAAAKKTLVVHFHKHFLSFDNNNYYGNFLHNVRKFHTEFDMESNPSSHEQYKFPAPTAARKNATLHSLHCQEMRLCKSLFQGT